MDDKKINELTRFIYNVAIRMLWNKYEAEDVTQDIMLKVISNIDNFRNESKIETWVYRIAFNHIVNFNKKSFREISIENFSKDINIDYQKENFLGLNRIEEKIYVDELKISCTHALLQCLDKENRMIFILGNLFEIKSNFAGEALDIKPTLFRKRLSRANQKIKSFLKQNCGLVNKDAKCKCKKRLQYAFDMGRLKRDELMFYTDDNNTIADFVKKMNELDEVSELYKSFPYYTLDQKILEKIQSFI